ncbi:hypothetical protein [uncultured Croceitalea sp.]|uniref:hypothetical protein n=1 Tax=uncultured Croceitalea sp. TaxID=1798908 RepID=UPI003305C84B
MNSTRKNLFVLLLLTTAIINGQNHISLKPSDFQWDLKTLFNEKNTWDEEIKKLRLETASILKLEGLIAKDYKNLEMVLDSVSSLRSKAAKLVVYTALKENLDYTSSIAQQRFLTALEIEDEIEAATCFINKEIAGISEQNLTAQLKGNENLEKHLKRINRIKEEGNYRLSNETEKTLLGMKRLWLQSGQTHQAIFENEKLDWPEITLSNQKKVVLTPSQFYRLRKHKERDERANASITFLEYLEKYKDILAIQLTKRIEIELELGLLRGFPSGIDSEFYMRDGFPIGSTDIFRKAALDNNKQIQRYCSIISSLNDGGKQHYSDIYIGTASVDRNFSLGESIDIVYKATEHFGEDYTKKLDSLLQEKTFHLEMTDTKRIMWAIYPPVGGAKPYTIMPYDGSFRASSVISRALVGNLAQHHYLPDTRDDPPVYNNGIIYVGSLLHRDYFVKQAKSKKERLTYLQAAAYGLYNTFFKYAVYASFEHKIEEKLINGESPNGEEVSKIYYGVLKEYFGDEIEIPEAYAYEWMTIAQPFNTYEHQYWPVAMAAACGIMENLNDPDIMNLLVGKTTPESDRSYQILKAAGIDFLKADSYTPLFNKMKVYLDDIEELINKK